MLHIKQDHFLAMISLELGEGGELKAKLPHNTANYDTKCNHNILMEKCVTLILN